MDNLDTEAVADERDLFEQAIFKKYFISTVVVNPDPKGMRLINKEETMDKATFCRRSEKGYYVEEGVEPAWWAWQECAKRCVEAKEDRAILDWMDSNVVAFGKDDFEERAYPHLTKWGFWAPVATGYKTVRQRIREALGREKKDDSDEA